MTVDIFLEYDKIFIDNIAYGRRTRIRMKGITLGIMKKNCRKFELRWKHRIFISSFKRNTFSIRKQILYEGSTNTNFILNNLQFLYEYLLEGKIKKILDFTIALKNSKLSKFNNYFHVMIFCSYLKVYYEILQTSSFYFLK